MIKYFILYLLIWISFSNCLKITKDECLESGGIFNGYFKQCSISTCPKNYKDCDSNDLDNIECRKCVEGIYC